MMDAGKEFTLNYSLFKKSFENPIEFSFLSEGEMEEITLPEHELISEEAMNFFGISLDKWEQEKLIMRKINRKAELSTIRPMEGAFLSFLDLELRDIYYFGDWGEWTIFIEEIKKKDKALIFRPQIKLKLKGFHAPVLLSPDAIFYSKGKFALILFSSSKLPGKSNIGKFIFNEFFFREFLGITFSEFAIVPKRLSELQFTISLLKSPTDKAKSKSIPIYKLFGATKTLFLDSVFSSCLSEDEYSEKITEGIENDPEIIKKFLSEFKEFRTKILIRLKELDNLTAWIQSKLPEGYMVIDWFKKIKWTQMISLQSLRNHYLDSQKSNIFSVSGKPFKKALSMIFPNIPIINSSLVDIKKAFELARVAEEYQGWRNTPPNSFNNFLGSLFNPEKGFVGQNSIFSYEGKELLQEKILEIKWQIYYDFESYEELLTQLSLQIFRENRLFFKDDLIKDPWVKGKEIEKESIEALAKPILVELFSELESCTEEYAIQKLKSKIVYIAFNKTFECTWLEKMKIGRLILGDEISAKLCGIIKALTVDLSDWFKFSKNSSLNLIGELLGSHTLKKLANIVTEQKGKRYSQLEWAQSGREASLMYFYFYSEIFNAGNEKELPNEELAPIHWVKGQKEKKIKEWNVARVFLQEYCALDVQNMVDGVKWLVDNYAKNKNELVQQSDILNWITWFKELTAPQLGELINNFLKQKQKS